MEKFIIQGGKRLHGSVRLGGAKNASFKLMIAALLAKGESRLLNVPQIYDVENTRNIITHLGGKVTSSGERMVTVTGESLRSYEIPEHFGKDSRASTMFIVPLLVRLKKARVPLPGGDRIGARPLDRHLAGLKALGVKFRVVGETLEATVDHFTSGRFHFAKPTHTGTELLIMAGAVARGRTILENASLEPEIDDFIAFLNTMGAKIGRSRGRRIEIEGVEILTPQIHSVMPDRNEAVTYACAAIATRGDIIVENVRKNHIQSFLEKLGEAGGSYEVARYGIRFFSTKPLTAVRVVTSPHPGFMTDWQPIWAVLMTQASGTSIIHETVHANRFQYVSALRQMGAKIELFNPKVENKQRFYQFNIEDDRPEYKHAARIIGPTPLKGKELKVHDLRAGATLVLSALAARGESTVIGVEHIDRGYENLDGKLMDLGAAIKRV